MLAAAWPTICLSVPLTRISVWVGQVTVSVGYTCIAEVRTIETIRSGAPVTPFLKVGDSVRIWMDDDRHHPIFGVIEQTVA